MNESHTFGGGSSGGVGGASFLIGICIGIGSSALSSFGINVQARSLRDERILYSLSERDPELLFDMTAAYDSNTVFSSSHNHQDDYDLDENIDETNPLLPTNNIGSPPVAHPSIRNRVLIYFYGPESVHDPVVLAKTWLRAQWYLGFFLYLICQLFGSVIALNFISPLLLAPLGSTGLVFNIIFAWAFLGTRITVYDWIGTIMICIGCSIVSLFGNKIPDPDQDVAEMLRLFTKPTFIAYFCILLVVSILLFVLIKSVEWNLDSLRQDLHSSTTDLRISRSRTSISSRLAASVTSTDGPVLETVVTDGPPPLETATSTTFPPRPSSTTSNRPVFRVDGGGGGGDSPTRRRTRQLIIETSSDLLISPLHHPPSLPSPGPIGEIRAVKKGMLTSLAGLLYAILGGTVASLTLLLTKSGVSIAPAVILSGKGSTETTIFICVLVILLVVSVVVQIYSLNTALKYQLPVLVLPLFFTFYTCLSLLNTMVYVGAFATTSAVDILILFAGVGVLVSGVCLLGRGTQSQS